MEAKVGVSDIENTLQAYKATTINAAVKIMLQSPVS